MNKKFMLLGLCMMGAFSAAQADETESSATETPATSQDATVAVTTPETPATVVDEKDKGCGCKR
jgi:hypothetical protein